MTKFTAVAAANIALIKYWGMRDTEHTLPVNASISMTLSQCVSRCTIETKSGGADEVLYQQMDGRLLSASPEFADKVRSHLDRLRNEAKVRTPMRVATTNNFPTGAGIASSASGFAALTIAAAAALGLAADTPTWSRLARLSGSGSAARSVLGGFVQWPADAFDPEASARQIAPPEYWPLRDLVVVVDASPKKVSSREGHRRALSSPYYPMRQQLLPDRIARVRQALATRDFLLLAAVVEEEAIDLHLIAMSAQPPTFYWQPATLAVLETVRRLRADGLDVCATIDAGPNVHVLCTPEHASQASAVLAAISGVQLLIEDGVGNGPSLTHEHLL